MPKTKLGKWSVACAALFFAFMLFGNLMIATGQEGGETFFDNLYISIPMGLALLSGIAAFGTGLTAIVKSKERAAMVYIAVVIGLLILVFAVGELVGTE